MWANRADSIPDPSILCPGRRRKITLQLINPTDDRQNTICRKDKTKSFCYVDLVARVRLTPATQATTASAVRVASQECSNTPGSLTKPTTEQLIWLPLIIRHSLARRIPPATPQRSTGRLHKPQARLKNRGEPVF